MLAIAQKLAKLSSLHQESEALAAEKKALMDQLIPADVQARLEEIEIEFAQKLDAARCTIETLEAEIKSETLQHGETIKASGFLAIWMQGRVVWDNKGLSTYGETHPEILSYRKQGDPTVTIRREQSKSQEQEA